MERVQQAIVFFNFHPVLSPIRSLIFLGIKASNLECDRLHRSSSVGLRLLPLPYILLL